MILLSRYILWSPICGNSGIVRENDCQLTPEWKPACSIRSSDMCYASCSFGKHRDDGFVGLWLQVQGPLKSENPKLTTLNPTPEPGTRQNFNPRPETEKPYSKRPSVFWECGAPADLSPRPAKMHEGCLAMSGSVGCDRACGEFRVVCDRACRVHPELQTCVRHLLCKQQGRFGS